MHQEHGLQFRAYVPTLMELLEDADGTVRDVAKSTVIELFRYALADPSPPFFFSPCPVDSREYQERSRPREVRFEEAAEELQSPPGNRISHHQRAQPNKLCPSLADR